MLPSETRELATGGMTIDLMIKTVDQLYKVIQDTGEGVRGKHTQEPVMLASKSLGGETLEEITSGTPMVLPTFGGSSGTELIRSESAPPGNLPTHADKIRKLQDVLSRIKRNQRYMKRLQLDVENEMKRQLDFLLSKVVIEVEPSGNLHNSLSIWIGYDLEYITKKLDVMSKVIVLPQKQKKRKPSPDYQGTDGGIRGILCLPGIHESGQDLKRLAVFRYVKQIFEKLSIKLQICLLSFAVFPENQEVNRTMLMYWWIGEGILPDYIDELDFTGYVKLKNGSRHDEGRHVTYKPEYVVKVILKEFVEKKLIEPVQNKRKLEPNSYKMTPFMHSSVVLISKEIGLFDMYDKGKKPAMKQSRLRKVCLVEGSSSQPEAKAKNMPEFDCIETVFNVSERFPDFTCSWFLEEQPLRKKKLGALLKNTYTMLKVFYLGRWERTGREIEVDSRRVMKSLSFMTKLRFLSLQGISTIKILGPSACKLTELIILDLRGCYNLVQLPNDIDKLENLVYLDMTDCEALESIPMNLSRLKHLEVLKGFVVSDDNENACKLVELKRLLYLRKLSVTVDREDFGLTELVDNIKEFGGLESLKVRWESGFSLSKKHGDKDARRKKHGDKDARRTMTRTLTVLKGSKATVKVPPEQAVRNYRLPGSLRKLDLQRFPDRELPDWLQPKKIYHLEKLHLGSSRRLKGFGDSLPEEPTKCSVKVLRLTCMPKLKVEWRDLTQLYFPKMEFLEMYECPRVTLSPCDRDGIWRRPGP